MFNKKTIFIVALTCLSVVSFAIPNWSVDETTFSNTMTITGIVNINNLELSDQNDMVAAFVGNECRGVAHLLPSTVLGHAYAYLMVMSNANNETITFKVFRSSDGSVISVIDNTKFTSDIAIGTQESPYLFSDKTVNGKSILSFSLGVSGEVVIIDSLNRLITVTVPTGTDVSAISPVIIHSIGSHAMVAGTDISANTKVNLTQTVTISIVAQNGTTSSWSIITNRATDIDVENDKKYAILQRNDGALSFSNFPESARYIVFTIAGQIVSTNAISNYPIVFFDTTTIPYFVVVNNKNGALLYSKLLVK